MLHTAKGMQRWHVSPRSAYQTELSSKRMVICMRLYGLQFIQLGLILHWTKQINTKHLSIENTAIRIVEPEWANYFNVK